KGFYFINEAGFGASSVGSIAASRKSGGALPRRPDGAKRFSAYWRSLSTLCCDWLASASAETAIDWRVDSAWLLAASSLESARVRLADPVCSTLMMFFAKSWRICTIERLAPNAEACERSVLLALLSAFSTLPVSTLSMKSVPGASGARPRPFGLKLTPAIVSVDLPVSLKISFSELPSKRLMPLNDASCAVVLICSMTWLYWVTSVARAVCDTASGTVATTVPPAPPPNALALMLMASSVVGAVGDAVPVIVWAAPSLVDVKVSSSVLVIEPDRLTPATASAVLSWSSVLTVAALVVALKGEAAVPIVIVTAVPAELVNVKTPPLSLLVVRSAAVAGPAGGTPVPVPVNAMLDLVL